MTAEPISWPTAKRVARRVARADPFGQSYLRAPLDDEMARLTREAEPFVTGETGLDPGSRSTVRVVERDGWASANVDSYRHLLEPLTEKLSGTGGSRLPLVARSLTAVQLGVILGWMSQRVLGQYVPPSSSPQYGDGGDVLYYVAPNMLAMEKKFAFPPEEFRFWIALHECCHRAQFMGVPWMAGYLESLIGDLLTSVELNQVSVNETLDAVVREIKQKKATDQPIDLTTLFTTPEQRGRMKRVQGLMALLEGHAEVVMSRAATERMPNVERFHRVIEARRNSGSPLAKMFQKLLGLDAKMRQYAEGAKFLRAVEDHGGRQLASQVWRSPEDLPDYEEIRRPQMWIARHEVSTTP